MYRKQELQLYVNLLARIIPALGKARVIEFGHAYEVWINPYTTLVVGSYGTVMLWLGCVALTKCVRRYDLYPAYILHAVISSAQLWGVI